MKIEILKPIKIGIDRKGLCEVGETIDIDKEAAKVYISKGFAKESEPKLTGAKVVELILNCKSIEDLKQYEKDDRQVVVAAFNKKLKELE